MVRCIKCGKPSDEALIGVDVNTAEIHCGECDETYTVDDVREQIEEWGRLVRWIELHPANDPDAAPAKAAK